MSEKEKEKQIPIVPDPPKIPIVPPSLPNPELPNPNKPIVPTDDPMVVEYAELLKSQLGELYEPALDKMPLKERIAEMKIVKKTMDKLQGNRRSEGQAPIDPKPPVNTPIQTVVDKCKDRNYDPFKEISRNSVFGFSMNKKE